MLDAAENISTVKKNYDDYVKPFSSDTATLRTDGQICYINIARQYADAR